MLPLNFHQWEVAVSHSNCIYIEPRPSVIPADTTVLCGGGLVISDFHIDIKGKLNLCVSCEKDIKLAVLNIVSISFKPKAS